MPLDEALRIAGQIGGCSEAHTTKALSTATQADNIKISRMAREGARLRTGMLGWTSDPTTRADNSAPTQSQTSYRLDRPE